LKTQGFLNAKWVHTRFVHVFSENKHKAWLARKSSTYTKWAVSFLSDTKILPCQGRLICAHKISLIAMLAAHISRSSQTLDTTPRTQSKQVNRHNVAIGLVTNYMLPPHQTKTLRTAKLTVVKST